MFRRSKTLKGRGAGEITNPFDDSFWFSYYESYLRLVQKNVPTDNKPVNPKKYLSVSSSVDAVKKFFEAVKHPVPSTSQIIALLKSPYTGGDVVKTFHLIRYFQFASEGLFMTIETKDKLGSTIRLAGAENWENVMCYMDALLFAMFANLELFEPILFVSNQHRLYLGEQLGALLRLYVSLLRLGNLITTDITMRICETLQKLGFTQAMSHKQQDCTDLFEFLAELLHMPKLTFRVDIKHGGKYNKEDDEKFLNERVLFVSIPESSEDLPNDIHKGKLEEGTPVSPLTEEFPRKKEKSLPKTPDMVGEEDPILLEECLEHYFNNLISVKRELERRATLDLLRYSGYNASALGEVSVIPEDQPSLNDQKDRPSADYFENRDRRNSTSSYAKNQPHPTIRTRSSTLSIWSQSEDISTTLSSKISKEVSLPAWMFLRLLPFYTDDNNMIQDQSVVHSLLEFVNRRPVLPICLKRYSFNNSTSHKSKRRIVIPPVINLPNFVADDTNDTGYHPGGYRLVLESAVCHRGNLILLGHFVSAIRRDKTGEDEDSRWILYDDMRKKGRTTVKTFKEIFESEWPYMLFYRLVPNDDDTDTVKPLPSSSVSAPPGSKSKYWTDDALSPIVSAVSLAGNLASNVIEAPIKLLQHDKQLPDKDVSTAEVNHESIDNSRKSSDEISIPTPEISPLDPQFIDIRTKYYWYLIDKEKNYYKELSIPSRSGTRESSIVISPQFRRNSQWSDSDKKFEDLVKQLSIEPTDISTLEEPLKVKNQSDHISRLPERGHTISHQRSHHTTQDEDERKHIFRRGRKIREDYHKEKCTIM